MSSVKVLDGGFSTQLALVTGDVIDGHPLWSSRYLAEDPQAVLQTHVEFLKAGAEIIITNSYQASLSGFMTHLGVDEKASYELIRESVRIAQCAVNCYLFQNPDDKKPEVAGSVGPYGACLHDGSEYTGNYVDTVDMKTILDWHRPRIATLIAEGVDYLAIETIPALSEAIGLLNLLKQYPKQKIWVSFQCKDDEHLAHGESFPAAVKKCWEVNKEQLVAVGCNCVNPKYVPRLLRTASEMCNGEIPLIVYPNSGEEYSPTTGWSGKGLGADFTRFIPELLDLGVKYIGGCCRTDARHISMIRDAVRGWASKQ